MNERVGASQVCWDVALVLAILGWLIVPAVLAYGGFIVGAPFLGQTPTDADRALSARFWTGAGAALIVFPALGLWCAARRHRSWLMGLFGIGAAAGLVLVVAVVTIRS